MLDSSRYPRSLGSSGPQLALKIEPPQQNLSHHDWTSSNGHPYYLTPPLSSTTSSFYEHDSLNYGDLVGDVDAQSDQHLFGQADLFGEPFECSNDSIQSSTSAYKFDDNLLGAGIAAFS